MPEKYPPRAFRYKVTIDQLAGTQDATGAVEKTWTTFTNAWVSIEQLNGSERVVAQQLNPDVSVRMWMKWQDGISPTMRVSYGSRHFDIMAVMDLDGKRRFLQLLCNERVGS